MRDKETGQNPKGRRRWHVPRFDALLLVFLTLGWSLIFAIATLTLQRNPQQWLSADLESRVSADYGVDTAETSKLAPIRPQIIEAVRQDAIVMERLATPTVVVVEIMPTPSLTPSPTLTPTLPTSVLVVSAGGPYIGEEGSPVSLVAGVAGSVTETLTYRWDLNDDGVYNDAQGASTSVVFYDEGEYTVGVQVSDQDGWVAADTAMVRVSNVAPVVDVGGDRYTAEGEEIAFQASASDPGHDVLFYYWDLGDGTQATGTLSPRHTYLDNGGYTVRLRAEDNDGAVTEASFVAHVGNLPPVVDAGPDQVTTEGSSVVFSGTASDPGVFDSLSYAWDLNYDGLTFTPDAFGPAASAVYPDGPAAVVAALQVEDKDGGKALDTVNVSVNNVGPAIASVTNDGPVGEGSPVTLVVNATDVGSDTLTYAFDWENDGDFDILGQPAVVSHIWYNQGVYTVSIRADDGDGGQAFTTTAVSAYNVAPTAIAGPEVSRLEGSAVVFDGSGSSDPGIYDVLTYQWSFGDGSPIASGITATHSYADNNVYSATLAVTDDSGAGDTDSVPVTILNANPVADAGDDRVSDEGMELNFVVGAASDPGADDTLTFAWDFDFDGDNFDEDATGMSVDSTYPDGPANYVVALRVRDDDYPYPTGGGGEIGEAIDTLQVTVDNLPPVAEANGPYSGTEMQRITLSGTGLDVPADVLSYEWDLDDNGTFELAGQSVITAWNTAGVYTVTLRVTDDDGDAGSDIAQVTIGNAPPTADAGGPYVGDEGRPIVLIGIGSDPINDPLTYTWDLDYDSIFETPGQVVTNTWPDDGVYTVTLRVDDGRGGVTTDDAIVIVNNVPPTADAGPDQAVVVGDPVTLAGSATDPGADVLTFEWDFDYDGFTFDVDATGQIVTTSYSVGPATYTVGLRVTDDDGGIGFDTAQVTVINAPPTADAGGPYVGDEGSPIVLIGVGFDPDGDPLTYTWDLDYDSIFETPGQVVTNTWSDNGVYTVTLRVDDGRSGVATDDATVVVNNVPPTADAGLDQVVVEGDPVNLVGNATDPGADTFTFEWDFDYDNITFDVDATGQTVVTSYPGGPAIYTVALRVTDDDGGIGFDTAQVTVIANQPPTADAGGPYVGDEGIPILLTGAGFDPNGDPLTYAWDLDYDSTFETPGQVVTNTWPDDGVYTVTLQVGDGRGGVDANDATVIVNNVPPIADAGGPYTTTAGITVTLVGTGTDVLSDTLTYTWDLNDDGFFDDGTGQVVTYVWTTTGIYTVTFQVDDGDGGITTDATTVNVNSLFPVVWLGVPYFLALSREVIFLGKRRTRNSRRPGHRQWPSDRSV